MWGRKRYKGNQDKLNMFLESVEQMDEITNQPPASKLLRHAEAIAKDMLDNGGAITIGYDYAQWFADDKELQKAVFKLIRDPSFHEESKSVSDAAKETNDKVQDAEDESESPEEEEPVVDEPVDDEEGEELQEGLEELKQKAADLLAKIDAELEDKSKQGPGPFGEMVNKLAVVFAKMTESEGDKEVIVDETKQFSEFDYVINSASAIAEEFKLDENKVRDMLATEMKHYKESDISFNVEEFNNKVANHALKESCSKKK